MGKGEIDRYEQFLLSHSVFKRFVLQTHKNKGLFGKGLKSTNCKQVLAPSHRALVYISLGDILPCLFPCFLIFQRQIPPLKSIEVTFNLSSANIAVDSLPHNSESNYTMRKLLKALRVKEKILVISIFSLIKALSARQTDLLWRENGQNKQNLVIW